MGQLQLFTRAELAGMRDRTRARNYSVDRDEFRREHEHRRSWGLQRRNAERLRHVRERQAGCWPADLRMVWDAVDGSGTGSPDPSAAGPVPPSGAVRQLASRRDPLAGRGSRSEPVKQPDRSSGSARPAAEPAQGSAGPVVWLARRPEPAKWPGVPGGPSLPRVGAPRGPGCQQPDPAKQPARMQARGASRRAHSHPSPCPAPPNRGCRAAPALSRERAPIHDRAPAADPAGAPQHPNQTHKVPRPGRQKPNRANPTQTGRTRTQPTTGTQQSHHQNIQRKATLALVKMYSIPAELPDEYCGQIPP
jgi:hypothetical protein